MVLLVLPASPNLALQEYRLAVDKDCATCSESSPDLIDEEQVSCGQNRCHVHVLGRSVPLKSGTTKI